MSDIRNIINLLEGVQKGEKLEEINRLARAVAAGSLGLMTALGTPTASHADAIDVGGQRVVVSKSPKGERFMMALAEYFKVLDNFFPEIDQHISKAEMDRLLAKAERFDNPGIRLFEPVPNKPIAAQIEANMENDPTNDGMD